MAAPKYRRTRLALTATIASAVVAGSAYFSVQVQPSDAAQVPLDNTASVTSFIQATPTAQRQPATPAPARKSRGS